MRRAVVDPRFPARLRELRQERGLSFRRLADRVYYSKSLMHQLETGEAVPTVDIAARLDEALSAQGELAAMVVDSAPVVLTADDDARLLHVARNPRRVDRSTVDSLAAMLGHQRRLEDSIGAEPLIDPVTAQLVLIEALADDARGAVRPAVVNVASQWAQFLGWLSATTGDHEQARHWYARAVEWSTETGDGNMTSTVLNLRGHLAWIAGKPAAMIGLSQAALRQPASAGVRALAAQQEARGHALSGEADDAERGLDLAEELAVASGEQPDHEPPWIYFYNPDYLVMQRALAFQYLGRHARAVELFTAGLAGIPEHMRRAEWVAWYVYRLAVSHAKLGNRADATAALEEARSIAVATHSRRLTGEVETLARRLGL